jgi:hypothetical protein
MLTNFLRAMNRCRSFPCPAGDNGWFRPRNEVRLKHRPAESEHLERKLTGSFIDNPFLLNQN